MVTMGAIITWEIPKWKIKKCNVKFGQNNEAQLGKGTNVESFPLPGIEPGSPG